MTLPYLFLEIVISVSVSIRCIDTFITADVVFIWIPLCYNSVNKHSCVN